jgi:hypothetical protein
LKTCRYPTIMLACVVTILAACASGGSPGATADSTSPDPAPAPGALAIIPASLQLAPGDSAQLAAVIDDSAVEVSWAVEEDGGGTVSDAGVYTAAGSEGTFHVVAASRVDTSKKATTVVSVKKAAPPAPSSQGTGTAYQATYLTGVTGGGAMPSWTGAVVTASCAGDGSTDDTACLQGAANAARDQGKPLVIPATSSYYRVTGPVTISTSVGGVGGMPTIRQTNTSATWGQQKILILARGMSGWIWNLHLVGTFDGSNAVTEFGANIDVGNVNGVTIKGNLLENAMGDSIGTDISQWDGGSTSSNVLVDGNTMRNPYRCAVAFVQNQRSWVVVNNVIEKPVNFVSGIDVEPEGSGSVQGVEVAYNRFVMDNRTPNPNRGADGKAFFAWQTAANPAPGGSFWLHNNYGTFGTGFFGASGSFSDVHQDSNVEGQSVP